MSKVWQWAIRHNIKSSMGLLIIMSIVLLIGITLINLNAAPQSDLVLTMKARLANANTGDMIVATNNNRTKGCVLVVQRQMSDLAPPQMTATFPLGKCVETLHGAVWYSEVVRIAGDNGALLIIPQKNAQPALNAILGMAVNFQH